MTSLGPIVLVAEEGFLFSADGSWDGNFYF